MTRTDNRAPDELRSVKITPGFLVNAEGSALIEMGNTRVICAVMVMGLELASDWEMPEPLPFYEYAWVSVKLRAPRLLKVLQRRS